MQRIDDCHSVSLNEGKINDLKVALKAAKTDSSNCALQLATANKKVDSLQAQLTAKMDALSDSDTLIKAKDARVNALLKDIENKDERIRELESQPKSSEEDKARIKELEGELESMKAIVDIYQQTIEG